MMGCAVGEAGFTTLVGGAGAADADEAGAVGSHRGQGSLRRSPLPSHTGQRSAAMRISYETAMKLLG